MLRDLTLILTIAVSACGTGDPVIDNTHDICGPLAVVAGPEANATERQAIVDALALWRRAGSNGLSLEPAFGGPTITVHFEDAAPLFRGLYDDERGIVYVNHILPDGNARAITIAHELGHVFGLVHIDSDERASVMNPGNLTVEPTRSDWLAAAALGATCVVSP